jgi:hypothetical protein
MSGITFTRRVYREIDLKRAFTGSKTADLVVDYGSAWAVVEVSTHQIARDTVNGVSINGLRRDREAVLKEAIQVASTISRLRENERALTGSRPTSRKRFFPIILLTEGFPTNPLTTSAVREELRVRKILQEADVAPIEIIDVIELDMIEGAIEAGSCALPELLRCKEESNFHADSVRNFLVGDPRFVPRRPRRINGPLRRFFKAVARNMGRDGHEFDEIVG